MCGQRGWRELAVLGEKPKKFSGVREWFIWSPKSGAVNSDVDDWAFEEVTNKIGFHDCFLFYLNDSIIIHACLKDFDAQASV